VSDTIHRVDTQVPVISSDGVLEPNGILYTSPLSNKINTLSELSTKSYETTPHIFHTTVTTQASVVILTVPEEIE